jgi:hypothetical protein
MTQQCEPLGSHRTRNDTLLTMVCVFIYLFVVVDVVVDDDVVVVVITSFSFTPQRHRRFATC